MEDHADIARSDHRHARVYYPGATALVCATVFCVDLLTPLGIAAAVPYSLAVLMTFPVSSGRLTLFTAALVSVLTILGVLLSPVANGLTVQVITNRVIALYIIWAIVGFCLYAHTLLRTQHRHIRTYP